MCGPVRSSPLDLHITQRAERSLRLQFILPILTLECTLNLLLSLNSCRASYDARGLFGVPAVSDPWSSWLDAYYGGLDLQYASNIVFSNGALDPWTSGGVLENISSSLVSILLNEGT